MTHLLDATHGQFYIGNPGTYTRTASIKQLLIPFNQGKGAPFLSVLLSRVFQVLPKPPNICAYTGAAGRNFTHYLQPRGTRNFLVCSTQPSLSPWADLPFVQRQSIYQSQTTGLHELPGSKWLGIYPSLPIQKGCQYSAIILQPMTEQLKNWIYSHSQRHIILILNKYRFGKWEESCKMLRIDYLR